jgi:predicted nucleotidyltransferase
MDGAMALAKEIAREFGAMRSVVAVALTGSHAGGETDDWSDLDVLVYTVEPLPPEVRRETLGRIAGEVSNVDYWGPATVGRSPTGAPLDVAFFESSSMEAHLRAVLQEHRARLGYTTALAYTVQHGQSLHDPSGWLARMQAQVTRDYPGALARNIIALNWPALRDSSHSYRKQLGAAIGRGDAVSVNHRIAALLASYFDVLFALNRVYHPGEKKLVPQAERLCKLLPGNFAVEVAAVASASGDVAASVDALLDSAERLLQFHRAI